MRKTLSILLLAVAVLAVTVTPGHAGWRGGVFVGVGPYWGPYPYYYYPPPPAHYIYRPPTVVVEQPPVYVERPPVEQQPVAPAASTAYWYYCESARGYYPSVPSCAEEWVKVPERSR
jgi:hypothetical protein